MATMTLDELRADVERKYGDFVLALSDGTPVNLRAGMRLPKEDRVALRELQRRYSELSEADEGGDREDELVDIVAGQIEVISDDAENARRLVSEIGDDLALLMSVMTAYMEATQPGEA